MKTSVPNLTRSTSSAPRDHGSGSGDGSLIATIISRGGTVARQSNMGTFRPFGQDIGSADDSSLLRHYSHGADVS